MICKIITGRLEVWDKTPLCCFAMSLLVILSCNQVTQRKTTLGSKLPLSEMISFVKLVPRSSNQKYFNNVGTSLHRKVFQSVFFSPAFKNQPRVPWVQTRKKRETWQSPLLAFTKLYTKTQASNISIIKIAASLPEKISTELDVTTQSQLRLCKDLNTICQQNSDAPKLLQGSPFEPFEPEGLKRIKSRTAVYL